MWCVFVLAGGSASGRSARRAAGAPVRPRGRFSASKPWARRNKKPCSPRTVSMWPNLSPYCPATHTSLARPTGPRVVGQRWAQEVYVRASLQLCLLLSRTSWKTLCLNWMLERKSQRYTLISLGIFAKKDNRLIVLLQSDMNAWLIGSSPKLPLIISLLCSCVNTCNAPRSIVELLKFQAWRLAGPSFKVPTWILCGWSGYYRAILQPAWRHRGAPWGWILTKAEALK